MNKKQKILIILGLTFALVSVLLISNQVWGQETATTTPQKPGFLANVFGNVIGWVGGIAVGGLVLAISYIVGFLASIVVLLGGALTNFALNWNYAILYNPLIEVGWRISRDLANLGFVLFIIIIAIATILRFQQYGAKNTLGKLIAVALLVNFSLVFAGIFIDFSNMLTRFFVNNITGAGLSGLGTALVAPINPQKFLEVKDVSEIEAAASSFGGTLKNIAGAFFSAVFTLITGFCLLAIAAMLLIRFISLSVLLVLVPLACLFWILPATSKLWGQWWNQFMRWILFAPIVSFFFYLAVYLSTKFDEITKGLSLEAQGIGKGTEAYIAFGNIPTENFFPGVANLVITIGFLIGGLIAANSLGITGAKTFLGMAQATGKWARGAIGRIGAAAATRPLRGTWAQTQIEKMQKAGLGGGRFARAIGAPIRTLGGALSTAGVQQGERAVQQAEARLKKRFVSDKSLAMALPTLGHEGQIAAVKRLTKNKTMNLVNEGVLNSMIGNKNTQNIFKRYGAGKEYEDFEKAAGRSTAMFTGKDKEGNQITREEAQKQLFKSYTLKDFESLRKKSITEDVDATARVKALIETNPGALSKLIPKFSGNDFDKFTGNLKASLPEEIEIEVSPAEPEEKDKEGKIIKPAKPTKFETRKTKDLDIDDITEKYLKHKNPKLHKALSKTLANRALGIGEYEYPPPAETT